VNKIEQVCYNSTDAAGRLAFVAGIVLVELKICIVKVGPVHRQAPHKDGIGMQIRLKGEQRDIFCRKIKIDDVGPVGSNELPKDAAEVWIDLVSLVELLKIGAELTEESPVVSCGAM
jgi:hypothetical protein